MASDRYHQNEAEIQVFVSEEEGEGHRRLFKGESGGWGIKSI